MKIPKILKQNSALFYGSQIFQRQIRGGISRPSLRFGIPQISIYSQIAWGQDNLLSAEDELELNSWYVCKLGLPLSPSQSCLIYIFFGLYIISVILQ